MGTGAGRGVKLELFPPAMSSAPFTYKDAMTGKAHKMAFFGGITCLVQHTSGAIEPKVGWSYGFNSFCKVHCISRTSKILLQCHQCTMEACKAGVSVEEICRTWVVDSSDPLS